jgi:CubicO group peptidase (beta-lactamase class C family)
MLFVVARPDGSTVFRQSLLDTVRHMDLAALDSLARETGFSGVIRVDIGDETSLESAYGFAHRGYAVPNTVETQFAVASGTKGLTALTVASLIEDGAFQLATTARSFLGDDLPLIADDVTVEHLLAHRSGIGDYFDEDAGHDVDEYVLPVPVHELATTEAYLAVLAGHAAKFAPGTAFAYSNSGYVVLALIAERAGGVPFYELVQRRVCEPAGMKHTEFLRSDELPGCAAVGYLSSGPSPRTNVFHLPVRGSGDGGIYATAADMASFWAAFLGGRIVPSERVAEMTQARSVASESRRYGFGFWVDAESEVVMLEGYDAGVSFRSVHDPARRLTYTVISNTSDGAWPITRLLADRLQS